MNQSSPDTEAVAWRIDPKDTLFLMGETVTDDPEVADKWRKAGCIVEPLGVLTAARSSAGTVDPLMTPKEFVNSILSACDASNWDADRNKGDYYRGLHDAYEAIQEIAIEYQTAMYKWTRSSDLAQPSPMLWCCHIRGPDEVHAAPDYETALAWSDIVNETNWRYRRGGKPVLPTSWNDCLVKAAPAPWPHSAESHAEDLPKSIEGFTVSSTECWTEQELAEAKAEAKELSDYFNTWPNGCHDPDSCARHLGCMYVQCSRHNKDGNEVAKEINDRLLSLPQRSPQASEEANG